MATIESSTKHTKINSSELLSPSLRDDFPILQQTVHGDHPLVFLDNAASTQRPKQVIEVKSAETGLEHKVYLWVAPIEWE